MALKKRHPRRRKAIWGGGSRRETTKNVKQTDKHKIQVDLMTSRQPDQNQSMNFMLTIQSCHISMTPRIAYSNNQQVMETVRGGKTSNMAKRFWCCHEKVFQMYPYESWWDFFSIYTLVEVTLGVTLTRSRKVKMARYDWTQEEMEWFFTSNKREKYNHQSGHGHADLWPNDLHLNSHTKDLALTAFALHIIQRKQLHLYFFKYGFYFRKNL